MFYDNTEEVLKEEIFTLEEEISSLKKELEDYECRVVPSLQREIKRLRTIIRNQEEIS